MEINEKLIAEIERFAYGVNRVNHLLERYEWVVDAVNGGEPHREPRLEFGAPVYDEASGETGWRTVLHFNGNDKSTAGVETVVLTPVMEGFERYDDLVVLLNDLKQNQLRFGGRVLRFIR